MSQTHTDVLPVMLSGQQNENKNKLIRLFYRYNFVILMHKLSALIEFIQYTLRNFLIE